jgi:hypothetical protein
MDTTAPSGDLLAESQSIFSSSHSDQVPCGSLSLTPDGGTVICGTQGVARGTSASGCGEQVPEFVAYSARTGKRLRVLASDQQPCAAGTAVPVWSDPAANNVIGMFSTSSDGSSQTLLGLAANGQLYSLPLPKAPVYANEIAF